MDPRKKLKKRASDNTNGDSTLSMHTSRKLVCLGIILGAHGIRGSVRIKSFTANPRHIASYGPLRSQDGKQNFNITIRGVSRGAVLAEITEITHRDLAEQLAGTKLFIERESLPPTKDDEFYHTDLIGLIVRTLNGEEFGKIKNILDNGAGDIIEVQRSDAQTVFFPFTREVVPNIDLSKGFMTISPPSETDATLVEEAEQL